MQCETYLKHKVCTRCLQPGHEVSACKLSLKCKGCQSEDHNTLICKQAPDAKKKPDPKKKRGKETSSNKIETTEEPSAADDTTSTLSYW